MAARLPDLGLTRDLRLSMGMRGSMAWRRQAEELAGFLLLVAGDEHPARGERENQQQAIEDVCDGGAIPRRQNDKGVGPFGTDTAIADQMIPLSCFSS